MDSKHSVPFLLVLTHLSQTVTQDTHFLLYWFPFIPTPQMARWDGGKSRETPTFVSLQPLRPSVPVHKAAHVCRDMPTSIEGCFCGRLRCPTWLPASRSLCVPLSLPAHPTLLRTPTEAASGFPPQLHSVPLTALRASRVACASLWFEAPLCSPRPRGLECCWAVRSLGSHLYICGAPPCCCLGPFSCSPVHRLCSQSPSLPLCGGWSPALLWI